jgi:UDP-glucose 4-epimerase
MRVVVTGASGNVGTSLLRSLAAEPAVDSVLGICRRVPKLELPKVEWRAADVASSALRPLFQGADAVVHLAWLIQPARDQRLVRLVNVDGSERVFRAAAASGAQALVYASSVGAYAPGPKDHRVDENWPTTGISSSFYSRHKSEVERLLDRFEEEHEHMRVVRLRPGLIFQRESGTEIGRYFAGPLLPARLLRFGRIPVVPSHRALRVQAVHADDVAEAYARVLRSDVRGPFNVASGPVIDAELLAEVFHGVRVPVPGVLLHAAAALSWQLRLQPVDAGWVEMGLHAPLMSCDRIESELGWEPERDAVSALTELISGMAERAHGDTPPLSADPDMPGRLGGLVRGRLPGSGNPY